MQLSLTDVFYGRRLRKSPGFADAEAEPQDPRKFGLKVRTSARIQEARDRLAQHTRASQARVQATSPFTPMQQRQIAEQMKQLEQERNKQISAAYEQFSGADLEHAMRMIHAMHDEKTKNIIGAMSAPAALPSPKKEENMERSLLDVFYGRRLRKAEERPPEEDDDLPGPDEDDYAYEEPSEEEMEKDPNWEHGYHPDGSRIIPERMHQDAEEPKPESSPRNVPIEELGHGDQEDPSLASVRQMISPRLQERPANHDPYIWPSLDRDARGKKYKKSESFAEEKEVFQKSVPFPMQMKYGPISPVRKFAK